MCPAKRYSAMQTFDYDLSYRSQLLHGRSTAKMRCNPHADAMYSRCMITNLTLTTPALLFPAISLLLLAYTNRFLSLAALTRELYARYRAAPDPRIKGQLLNLRYRIHIIKHMQTLGVASFFGCVLCMFVLFAGLERLGVWIFGGSLLLLLASLALSLQEIHVSIDALTLQIDDLDDLDRQAASANEQSGTTSSNPPGSI